MLDSKPLRNRRSTKTHRLSSSFTYSSLDANEGEKKVYRSKRTTKSNRKISNAGLYTLIFIGIIMIVTAILSTDSNISARLFQSYFFKSETHITQQHIHVHKTSSYTKIVTVDEEIDNVLKLLRIESDSEEASTDIAREVNMLTINTVQKHCIDELPFELSATAQNTLNSHVQFGFEQIAKKVKIEDFTSGKTVVTIDGTILDLAHTKLSKKSKYSIPELDYAECSLVNTLITKSKQLHLTSKKIIDEFSKTNEEQFQETKPSIMNKYQLNKQVYKVISMSRRNGPSSHHGAMSGLLKTYCPHVVKFLKKKSRTKIIEFASSVSNILYQLSRESTIHLSHDEIPAIDSAGYVVAVKTSLFKTGTQKPMQLGVDYSTCEFVEKLVYYRNIDLQYQIENALEELSLANLYAFEAKMDIMMVEHCANVVDQLSSKKTTIKHESSVYQSIFRGELLNLATNIADAKYIGDDYDYVVTAKGGILLRSVAMQDNLKEDELFECSIISQMASQNKALLPESYQENEQNQHKFDPTFQEKAFIEELKTIESDFTPQTETNLEEVSENKIESNAKLVVQHLLNDDNKYHFRRILAHLMKLYHEQHIQQMEGDMFTKILSEIEQFLTILVGHSLGVKNWPNTFVAVITKQDGRVLIQDTEKAEYSTLMNSNSIVVSEMLTAIFKEALEVDAGERKSIKELIAKRKKQVVTEKTVTEASKIQVPVKQTPNEKNTDEKQNAVLSNVRTLLPKNEKAKTDTTIFTKDKLDIYVGLIWKQMKKDGTKEVSEEIFDDLEKYCPNLFSNILSPISQTSLKMNVITIMDSMLNDPNAVVTNPAIIIESGEIVSFDTTDEQITTCPFISHLLKKQ